MNIIGMKKSNQVEAILRASASNVHSNTSQSKSLRMGDLKRKGGQIFTSNSGYTIRGMESMPIVAFMELLKKENGNKISVNYSSDLADNEQISATETPLWSIDKQDGNFHIKRNF